MAGGESMLFAATGLPGAQAAPPVGPASAFQVSMKTPRFRCACSVSARTLSTGDKMNRPERARTRAVQMAYDGNRDALALDLGIGVFLLVPSPSDGSTSYNQTLSEQRAASVFNFLVQRGVPARMLTTMGFGEAQPVVPNTSASNKAMNRRIEFTVLSNR